jgi:hypothetical protein
MHLNGYVQSLREDLARVAAIGDQQTARCAELLAVALEPSLGRRLQEALAEAALELSAQLERGRVEVRIVGGDPELVYVGDDGSADVDRAEDALNARITLRLPESLKSRLEAAAATRGVSLNAWLVQTLSRVLEQRPSVGRTRQRLTGYGKS